MNWFQSFWRALTGRADDTSRHDARRKSGPAPDDADPISLPGPISNFTPRAQQALALARLEADRLDHQFVGTEHVLLGMIKLGQGTAVTVLQKLGLDLETIRQAVEKKFRPVAREKVIGRIPYTPRVKKVLALAMKEARALNHTYVGTEHILLGLLREGDGIAAQVLKDLRVDLESTRVEILKELDPNILVAAAPRAPLSAAARDQAKSMFTAKDTPSAPAGDVVDTTKLYDVYCTDWCQAVTVYRNVRFKGVKHLFPRTAYDVLSGYMELRSENGPPVYVSRGSIIRFSEAGRDPAPLAGP